MAGKTRIALIEDDAWAGKRLEEILRDESFIVDTYSDGTSGLTGLQAKPVDLVLLDLDLPGIKGIDVLRRLRRQSQVPVIVLTHSDDESDVAVCLKEGANDYVRKVKREKIELDGKIVYRLELIARIEAVLSRHVGIPTTNEVHSVRKYGTLLVDRERRICEWDGTKIDLKGGPFLCLWELAEDPPKPKTYDELKKATSVEHIAGHIKDLRDAFGEDAIENLHNIGYRLGHKFGTGSS